MLERFYPNEYVNSVEDIDFDMYYKQGIRGVIFDIDNTLVPHGHPATDKSIEFFEKLRNIQKYRSKKNHHFRDDLLRLYLQNCIQSILFLSKTLHLKPLG